MVKVFDCLALVQAFDCPDLVQIFDCLALVQVFYCLALVPVFDCLALVQFFYCPDLVQVFDCLCISLCLCSCVPYSFFNSYYHKLSENVWVWRSRGSRSGDLVGCHHSRTNKRRTRKDRATQPMDHGRLR